MTPLEQRAGSLEETSRRNTQDIGQLGTDVNDVRGRADRAQTQADTALSRANEANTRATTTDESVNDLRNNVDKYSVQNTASVNFKFDSYQLTPEAITALDQLAAQIKDRENFILEIEGFADSTGSDQYNNQLTQKRANAVQRYLAEQPGLGREGLHSRLGERFGGLLELDLVGLLNFGQPVCLTSSRLLAVGV